jgi:hypothetical protein
MTLSLDKVHDFQRIPGTLEVRLLKTQPYVRIVSGGEPPIFVQGGVLYSEGGQRVTEIPDWFTQEVLKLSDTVRAEVGLPPIAPPAAPPPKATSSTAERETWTCGACGKTMPKRGRLFHEMHHKKRATAQEVRGGDPER